MAIAAGLVVAERGADRGYERRMIGDEGHWRGHKVKRNLARLFG